MLSLKTRSNLGFSPNSMTTLCTDTILLFSTGLAGRGVSSTVISWHSDTSVLLNVGINNTPFTVHGLTRFC